MDGALVELKALVLGVVKKQPVLFICFISPTYAVYEAEKA
jgi:hypothetical protein